jgi:hypothetical protein
MTLGVAGFFLAGMGVGVKAGIDVLKISSLG